MGPLQMISVSPVGKKVIGAMIVPRRMELKVAQILIVMEKARSPATSVTRTSLLTLFRGKRLHPNPLNRKPRPRMVARGIGVIIAVVGPQPMEQMVTPMTKPSSLKQTTLS